MGKKIGIQKHTGMLTFREKVGGAEPWDSLRECPEIKFPASCTRSSNETTCDWSGLECTVPPSSPLRHGAGTSTGCWWDGTNTGCTDLAQHTRIANESECASGAAIVTLDHPGIIERFPCMSILQFCLFSLMREPSSGEFAAESEKM